MSTLPIQVTKMQHIPFAIKRKNDCLEQELDSKTNLML